MGIEYHREPDISWRDRRARDRDLYGLGSLGVRAAARVADRKEIRGNSYPSIRIKNPGPSVVSSLALNTQIVLGRIA
jgi:hypothetical protein